MYGKMSSYNVVWLSHDTIDNISRGCSFIYKSAMLAVIFINISGGILSSNQCVRPDLVSWIIRGCIFALEIWNSMSVTQESQWQNIEYSGEFQLCKYKDVYKLCFLFIDVYLCVTGVCCFVCGMNDQSKLMF